MTLATGVLKPETIWWTGYPGPELDGYPGPKIPKSPSTIQYTVRSISNLFRVRPIRRSEYT